MRFDWITSVGLRPHGTFPQEHRPLSPDNGCRDRVLASLKHYAKNWAVCRLLSKIWVLLLRTCTHCVTRFNFLGPGSCSSLLTVIPTTHISRTTLFPTRSSIPAPMTMLQPENGTKNCPTTSGKTCGATSSWRRAEMPKPLRH